MKITTVVEVRHEEWYKVGQGSDKSVGEIIDMQLGRIVESHRMNVGGLEAEGEIVKEIIIDVQQFVKEVM